jgi:hypothetical protein
MTNKNLKCPEVKESLRDLGVNIKDKETFTNHIEHVCTKVTQENSWKLELWRQGISTSGSSGERNIQAIIDYYSQVYLPIKPTDFQ